MSSGDQITVTCRSCAATLQTAASHVGKQLKCPKCHTVIVVSFPTRDSPVEAFLHDLERKCKQSESAEVNQPQYDSDNRPTVGSSESPPPSLGSILMPERGVQPINVQSESPPQIESPSSQDFFSPSVAKIAWDVKDTQPSTESWNLYRLARQMMGAELYEEAYANASRSVVLDPSNVEAWATKGIAAAYTSKPPEFRLKEAKMCLTEALASTKLAEFVPSFSQHLISASAKYRKLLRRSCQDADDDASKEPLASDVDVGLQLSMRNRRISRIQTEKHWAGYFASIDAIKYAVDLNPSLQLLNVGLKEIDNVLSNASLSLGASKPATHGRFKTSRGVNVQ